MTNQVILYKPQELPRLPKLQEPPKEIRTATILNDSHLSEYRDSIQRYGEVARGKLGQFKSHNGELTGSNSFMPVECANLGLLPSGARLTERPDLEEAIAIEPSFGEGTYIDFGLALVTPGDSYKKNDLPARVLAESLEHRGFKISPGGVLVPYNVLKNVEHVDSACGLVQVLNDKAGKEDIRDLSAFKWNYGPRNEGLARAYLYRGRRWYSNDRGLDGSDSLGRVVVVSAEATPQKFLDEYAAKLEEQRQDLESYLHQVEKLQSRLRGG